MLERPELAHQPTQHPEQLRYISDEVERLALKDMDDSLYDPDYLVPLAHINWDPRSILLGVGVEPLGIRWIALTQSFDINFDGVGEAVGKLIDAVDPQRRRERQEELRHAREINYFDELEAGRQNATANLKTLIASHQMLVDVGVISSEEMAYSVRLALQAQTTATDTLIKIGASPAAIEKDAS